MKRYCLYIRSHAEAPDYEDEVEAENLKEASEKFWHRIPLGYATDEGTDIDGRESWSPEDLIPYIGEEK